MNIHQLRCAVTVARLGSQTRAAEELYMSQPNLSKALKDLEQTCGFRIFTRTGTGMAPTRRGEEFLEHARAVLEKLDLMDAIYQGQDRRSASLNVAVCGAGYLTRALCAFLDETNPSEGLEINMREGRVEEVVRAVLDREAEIGVIRYAVDRQNRVLAALAEQGLHYLLYWTFRHVAVMSRRHPLAGEERLEKARLAPYAEVTLAAELRPCRQSFRRRSSRAGAHAYGIRPPGWSWCPDRGRRTCGRRPCLRSFWNAMGLRSCLWRTCPNTRTR